MYHQLLAQQIEKHLKITGENVPDILKPFIDEVNETYQVLYAERKRMEEKAKHAAQIAEAAAAQQKTSVATNEGLSLDNFEFLIEQLTRIQRSALVGQLIGGIAHELNTPLAVFNAAIAALNNYLGPTMTLIGEVYKDFTPETEAAFKSLIESGRKNTEPLTTRDERQLVREMTAFFEGAGLEKGKDLAVKLVNAGLRDDYQQAIPILQHPRSEEVIRAAVNIGKINTAIQNMGMAYRKAGNMVTGLTAYFPADDQDETTAHSITQMIDIVMAVYHNKLKYGVEITKDYAADLPAIVCVPEELTQVFANIVNNAVQSMRGKGTLHIAVHVYGDNIEASFRDSGPGISEEHLAKIYEPFFTTKNPKEATGLGLFVCQRILRRYQAKIEVDPTAGATTFTVVIPIAPNTPRYS